MSKIISERECVELGGERGYEHVETVLVESGREAVIATLEPGAEGWDAAAINAAAHTQDGVPDEHREAYYAAYASAARERAQEIADEGEECRHSLGVCDHCADSGDRW